LSHGTRTAYRALTLIPVAPAKSESHKLKQQGKATQWHLRRANDDNPAVQLKLMVIFSG